MFRCDIIMCASLQGLHELYVRDSLISVPVQRGYADNESGEVASKLHLKDVYTSQERLHQTT